MPKIAVVTPYFNEPIEMLKRCHDSVAAQTIETTHYMVADGRPRAEIDHWKTHHIVLPQNIGSWGATPRGIGAIIAFAEGADAVAFLDADNWVEPDHAALIAEALKSGPELIIARSRVLFPDGDELPRYDRVTFDTNCIVLTRKGSFMAPAWAMFPTAFGSGEDGMTAHIVRRYRLRVEAITKRTVNYYTNWMVHYVQMGKKPLIQTKDKIHKSGMLQRWNSEVYRQATGIALDLKDLKQKKYQTKIDRNNARVAIISCVEGNNGGRIEEQFSPPADMFQILIAKERPDIGIPSDSGVFFHLPYPQSRPVALDETIAAIFAFQRGYDVVVFLDWQEVRDRKVLTKLVKEAAGLNEKKSRKLSVSSQSMEVFEYPAETPLRLCAVPRTIAGRFVHRNLARGVAGFEGRKWRRVLGS